MTVAVGIGGVASAAEDVRARLALRALVPGSPTGSMSGTLSPPPSPAAGSPAALKLQKEITVGVKIIVREDFMSDSGASDKVQLKKGQTGKVKRVSPAGHASIDFEEHKKLQWVAFGNLRKLAIERELEDPAPVPSLLRQQVFEQLNDALDSGFARRLARMQKKFELLRADVACGARKEGPQPAPTPPAAPALPAAEQPVSTEHLHEAVVKALRSQPLPKVYGPTEEQEKRPPVEDKQEDIVEESHTLHLTLQSLEQNISSRRRQITSLQQQVDTLKDFIKSVDNEAAEAAANEEALKKDPSRLQDMNQQALKRQRTDVEELKASLKKVEGSANRCRSAYRDQRRFLEQSERIMMMIGESRISKHPAGDVFVFPMPPPFDEARPERWDVGTAVANPYNVDSWPFEPNVLAARRHFNQELENWEEETEEDIAEENRRFRLQLPRHTEEGGTATSRSL